MKYEQQPLPIALGSSRQFDLVVDITEGAA
jgi:hypothetical protein